MELEATKVLAGVASTATAVTYTVMGDERDTLTNDDSFKVLAQGQLPNAVAGLATVGADKEWIIKSVQLVNTSGSPVTGIKLFVGGTIAANQTTATISLGAGESCTVDSDGVLHRFDATGTALVTTSVTLTGDVTGTLAAGIIATTLAAVGPGATGPIGSTSTTPVVTIDAKGRVTGLTSATITPAAIGAVASVTAGDASITVGGTATNPTVTTGRADQIFTLHPPTAAVNFNGQEATNSADPTAATSLATKAYVDNLIAALPSQPLVNYATAAALPAVTYNNGASGVGATLTANTVGALTVDGAPITTVGTSILVQNQGSQFQNGIYRVTTVGTALVAFVLTRRTTFDTAAEMGSAVLVPVDDQGLTPGLTNDDKVFLSLTSTPFVVGTTGITFQLIGSTYSADGTSITLTGTQFLRNALTGDITAAAGSSATTLASIIVAGGPTGSSTAVPVITYDAKGRITAVTTAATVGSVAATDASITVTGTATAPTISRAALTGDVAAPAGSNTTTLASVITAGGPTGSASVVPVITYDAKGRITAVTTATITPAAIGAPSGSGTSTGTNTGDASIGAATATPSANAGTFTGQVLNLALASASFPGLITAAQFSTISALGTASAKNVGNTVLDPGTGKLEYAYPSLGLITGTNRTYLNTERGYIARRSNGGVAMSDTLPLLANTVADIGATYTVYNEDTVLAAVLTMNASGGALFRSATGGTSATSPLNYGTRQQFVWDGTAWILTAGNANIVRRSGVIVAGNFPQFLDSAGNIVTDSGVSAATIAAKVASVTAADGSITVAGTATAPTISRAALTGDITAPAGSNATTLASVIVAGSVGSSTQIPVITYDAKGRITAVTTAAPSAGISGLTAVGAAPNANAGTIAGSNLTLQPSSAAFPGVMSASDYARVRWVLNAVSDFGFVGDNRLVFDGACNTAAPTKITSATAAFIAADLGKRITMSFAGAASGNAKYVGTITNIDSGTQVTVSPNISRTTSGAGLQVETDNTTAIGNMATAINALTYPGIKIVFPTSATNRYGHPIIVPTLNKPVTISAQGRFYNDDYGDYAKGGGTALVWSGATYDGGTAFRGLYRFEPVTGASAQHMHGTSLEDVWIDGRNGDQFPILYGVQMYSQEGFSIRRFGAIDCLAAAVEFDITSPVGGVAATARGTMEDFGIRCLETDSLVGVPTVTTTSSAVTLSTTPQNMTVAAAINTLYSAGYAWFETEAGYPVLVNFTGGGTTTTLTGCTVSAKDSALTPKTIAGCNVVFASPNNGAAIKLGGDSGGNTNLSFFRMGQVNHGANYGAAAIDCRNADSLVFHQVVVNGGNGATMATGPTVKRITKPGYRFTGSETLSLAARNIVVYDGDAGAGGVSSMALRGGGVKMTAPAGPNYVWGLQFGNGQPAPTIEAGSYLDWTSNGGTTIGMRTISMAAAVAYVAGVAQIVDGTKMLLAPQAFQVGTTFHWEFQFAKTGAGTTAHTLQIRVGAAGTTADATVMAFSLTTTAATDTCIMECDYTITSLTGGNANGTAVMRIKSKTAAATAGFWSLTTGSILVGTPTAFAAPVSGLQYISLAMTIGTATTGMSSSFGKGNIERVGLQAA